MLKTFAVTAWILAAAATCTITTTLKAKNPPSRPIASSFDDLRPASKKQLVKYAEHCVWIDGELWSQETLRDRERQTQRLKIKVKSDLYQFGGTRASVADVQFGDGSGRTVRVKLGGGTNGFVDPYGQPEAPNYIRLRDGATGSDLLAVYTVLLVDRIVDIPGVEVLTCEVIQVTDDGLLVKPDERIEKDPRDVFVEGGTRGYIEGDRQSLVVAKAGTYRYVTVRGASRTIGKYEAIPFDAVDMTTKPVRPDELFMFLAGQQQAYFPTYRPTWKVDRSPEFISRKSSAGLGMTRTSRQLASRGIYHWEWRLVKQPIDLTPVP